MKRRLLLLAIFFAPALLWAQNIMTPEVLWSLHRLSPIGISDDSQSVVYRLSTPDVAANKINSKTYRVPLAGGAPEEVSDAASLVKDSKLSPDGKYLLATEEVKIEKVYGEDFYPSLTKSEVMIYDELAYRHWDHWEDGKYSHVFIYPFENGKKGTGTDIMKGQEFDCPQQPFGGEEDYIWSPDGKYVYYVTKPASGSKYAVSTNTDIFRYEIATGKTVNVSDKMMGYDTNPAFSSTGVLAWLSMAREGYEADKNDIVVKQKEQVINLTSHWDNSVDGFMWANKGDKIFFVAAIDGTRQVFVVDAGKAGSAIRQITKGDFDVTQIVAQVDNSLIVTRTDMNHAADLYRVDLKDGQMTQLTNVNAGFYEGMDLSDIKRRYVKTTDNKDMLVWVIYPPNFDPAKKYPTLLYCQGGPQSPLTQFYSYRWNFQLIAANGYIVVAPNRRGMYGHGREWNEQISEDWGGQVMQDYLSAIDDVAKESYVDTSRLGCVGASFGGYSVFYLEGIHQNRFKTFISHDGVFDLRSMAGTTEELWFTDWEMGGNYWERENAVAQRSFDKFNPVNFVDKWTTPILIIQGGKDYRVPIGQGLQAFHAAQVRGIRSKLLYFPDENHWILKPQNALVWQNEFFKWLSETMP